MEKQPNGSSLSYRLLGLENIIKDYPYVLILRHPGEFYQYPPPFQKKSKRLLYDFNPPRNWPYPHPQFIFDTLLQKLCPEEGWCEWIVQEDFWINPLKSSWSNRCIYTFMSKTNYFGTNGEMMEQQLSWKNAHQITKLNLPHWHQQTHLLLPILHEDMGYL